LSEKEIETGEKGLPKIIKMLQWRRKK